MSSENPRKKILKSGKVSWEARYRDPSGRHRSKSFPRKKAADDFLAKQSVAISSGEWTDPKAGAAALRTLAEAWTAQATGGTEKVRRQLQHNLGELTDVPVGKLTPPLIRTWISHLQKGRPWMPGCTGMAPATVSTYFAQLKAMLSQVEDDGLISKNPAKKVRVPRPGTAITGADLPTGEQIAQLGALAENGGPKKKINGTQTWILPSPDLAVAIRLAAATGMRPGEVCGLSWPAVDFEEGKISVLAQADTHGTGLRALKTRDSGVRVLAVDAETMSLLKSHRDEHPGRDRVVYNRGGRPMVAANFAHNFRQLATYLGMSDTITPKSLRHFHATALLRAGVPIKAVQTRLGHTSAKMTLDVYAHFLPGDDHLAVQAAAGALSSGAGFVRDSRPGLQAV